MQKNMGVADRVIRTALALAITVLLSTRTVRGPLAIILGAFGVVFLITSAVSFCPLYVLLGVRTRGGRVEDRAGARTQPMQNVKEEDKPAETVSQSK
jgi:hypothetical protein